MLVEMSDYRNSRLKTRVVPLAQMYRGVQRRFCLRTELGPSVLINDVIIFDIVMKF